MTRAQKTRIRLVALALGVLALLAPITLSRGAVESNDACANGACCPEPGSVCSVNGEFVFDYVHLPKGCPSVDR